MVIRFNQTRFNAPVIPDDLATKAYVDAQIGGSPLTTLGDLFGFDSANARIPIGADTQILTADSGEALGLKWAAPAAGSGEANTSSNSGAGEGLALAKVAVDLPFKSLIGELNKIVLAGNAADITFTLGTDVVILTGAQTLTDKTLTSPILTTPALGTPASGVLTNVTGLVTAGMVDNAVTLAKMASGTDGNLITYDSSGNPAFVTTGTAAQVLTSNGAGAAPTFQAAAGGSGLTFARVFKQSDETVNNSTTYIDVADFNFAATANKMYHIYLMIYHTSNSTPDIKFRPTVPSGATFDILYGDWQSNVASDILQDEINPATNGTIQLTPTTIRVLVGGTAGDIDIQFAQDTANASNTTVHLGSIMLVWQEA